MAYYLILDSDFGAGVKSMRIVTSNPALPPLRAIADFDPDNIPVIDTSGLQFVRVEGKTLLNQKTGLQASAAIYRA